MEKSKLRTKVLNELNEHIRGKEYIGVISRLSYMENVKNSNAHLTRDEWHLLLGIWYKNMGISTPKLSEEEINCEYELIHSKLQELHKTYLPDTSEIVSRNYKKCPDFYKESVFYEGDMGYDFKYVSFLKYKYGEDADWLLKNKKIKLSKMSLLFTSIRKKLILNALELTRTQHIDKLNDFLCINIPDLIEEDGDYEGIINTFSFDVNDTSGTSYNSMEQISLSMEKPIIKLNFNTLYIPCSRLLAQSFYEIPFYWISNDKEYYGLEAYKHRGDAGINIVDIILHRIFHDNKLYKNIDIYCGKNLKTDIDYLVLHNNTAIVLQVKSKRYSLGSRQGNLNSIEEDYRKSILDAMRQAIDCEEAIFSKKCYYRYKNADFDADLFGNVTEVLKLCVTLDPFPAKETINKSFSNKDNQPIAMSVFELDIAVRVLRSSDKFIQYLRFRSGLKNKIVGDNENSYLTAYLLRNNVNEYLSKYDWIYIKPSEEIDKYMNETLMKEFMPDIFNSIYE